MGDGHDPWSPWQIRPCIHENSLRSCIKILTIEKAEWVTPLEVSGPIGSLRFPAKSADVECTALFFPPNTQVLGLQRGRAWHVSGGETSVDQLVGVLMSRGPYKWKWKCLRWGHCNCAEAAHGVIFLFFFFLAFVWEDYRWRVLHSDTSDVSVDNEMFLFGASDSI